MLLLASIAGAQAPDDGEASAAVERALDLFEEAERAYEAGEVERAVDLLVEARTFSREPILSFNLARAYETLGRIDEALEAYEGFLAEAPNVTDRGAIEIRIAALREQIAERERLARERREAEARAEHPDRTPSLAPWMVAVGGVALVVGGVVFGVLSTHERDDAVADPFHRSASASLDRAERFALTANVLFVAGGALALTGAIWGIVDLRRARSDDDAVALHLGPGGFDLRARW